MTNFAKTNTFLPILDTWETYFHHPDEGLGTTYERFILHRLFEKITANNSIDSVLEVPSFGMTGISGINSVWWAKAGKKVALLDWNLNRIRYIRKIWEELQIPLQLVYWKTETALPFKEDSFDLAWNFASLWFVEDLPNFAQELMRVSRKALLICVPNYTGLGYLIRKRYARLVKGLYLQNIHPRKIQASFSKNGWTLQESGIFDVPPWPDIAMKKEELFRKVGMGFLLKLFSRVAVSNDGETTNVLSYYADRNRELEKEILKYAIFERPTGWWSKFWGHHRYFIFRRGI